MTAARRLAAILAAGVGVARASGWHVRKPRQRQPSSKAVTRRKEACKTPRPMRRQGGRMKAASGLISTRLTYPDYGNENGLARDHPDESVTPWAESSRSADAR
jgi:hypothetical protein